MSVPPPYDNVNSFTHLALWLGTGVEATINEGTRHLGERGPSEPPDEIRDATTDPTRAEVEPGGKVGGDAGF